MRNNSENKTNEIKELEPGMLFYGKRKKAKDVIAYGILLEYNPDKEGSWLVRILTIISGESAWDTIVVPEYQILNTWLTTYEWVA